MTLKSLALILFGCAATFATSIEGVDPCAANQTLAYYMENYGALGGGSCVIGSLKYYNFGFKALKVTSDSVTSGYLIGADDINISLSESTSSFGLFPSSSDLFNRVITIPERYLITYTIDPPPIIAGDELYLDPPTLSSIYARKWGCVDSGFVSSGTIEAALLGKLPTEYTATMGGKFTCDSNPNKAPYLLEADGTSATEEFVKDQIFFDENAYKLDVRMVLDFQPGNIRGFDGTLPTAILTQVPEPSTHAMMLASLAGAACLLRRKRKI